ncbi:MAG TPA: HEAT repeat domain-containing protein [Pyrinomonadaceae bacterium]|nr:HEAT repeat domain-containing protein [Pyrinomonadaceae bacterium]
MSTKPRRGAEFMRRIVSLTIFALCLCCFGTPAAAQSKRADSAAVFRQLLDSPAPPPRAEGAQGETAQKIRPEEFYDSEKQPPDDAPDEDLLDYWMRSIATSPGGGPKPSDAVRRRLLAACEADPELLVGLLAVLPDDAAGAERVKKLFDAAQGSDSFDDEWRRQVREWLQFNSTYFLDELTALARKARDKEGYVDNEDALKAYAKLDREGARGFLRTLASGDQPRTATLATALLYRDAREAKDADDEEKYRAHLRAVAADRSAPASARSTAIETLSLTEWSGRDDWYLSLFEDETLLNPTDGSFSFNPLTTLFDSDPEKWIPVMTKLVESKSRAVQQTAATCLVLYSISHPRRDAILPVLRWLTEPDWISASSTYRAWFMQKMSALDVPESVPGLIWIVENDEGHRMWAARTLAHYKDPRAVAPLKKALAQESNESYRAFFIEGLVASGGLPEPEQLAALEAYAEKLSTSEGRADVERYRSSDEEQLPLPVSIGKYLAGQKAAPDSLAQETIARAEGLRKTNPAKARALLEIAEGWEARQVDLDTLRRIAAGTADAATINVALTRAERMRARVLSELRTLAASGGAAQGVAAVLLADAGLTHGALASGDRLAQTALLACARLTQTPLPVAEVAALLTSEDATLALAAERYLLAEDSREARRLLIERHTDEAFITGWRENVPYISTDAGFDAMGKAEEKLRAEILKDGGPREIYAMLSNDARPTFVLRVYADRAEYTHHENPARYRERNIPGAELANFKSFVESSGLAESGPQIGYCHHVCVTTELLTLSRRGGHRVISQQGGQDEWTTLFENFAALGRGEGAHIRYHLEDEIKGLEILLAEDSLQAKGVWQKGADLRVLVEREQTPEELEQEQKLYEESSGGESGDEQDEQALEAANAERQRRLDALARARVSWRTFEGGKLGATVARPETHSTFDLEAFEVSDDNLSAPFNEHIAQAIAGDSVVLAGYEGDGLWQKAAGRKAVRVSGEGDYANPVVAGARWVVAAKTDTHWGDPNYVVRLDLRTGREMRLELPPAEDFAPVAFVASHGKVLLRRARDEYNGAGKQVGPETPEFYLLDPATGRAHLVTGVFTPLQQEGRRSLQPASGASEFWAAVPNHAKGQTEVGRYNTKDFTFKALVNVPHMIFDSAAMWVDESAAKLYVVYEGQLLRLPLPNAPTRK